MVNERVAVTHTHIYIYTISHTHNLTYTPPQVWFLPGFSITQSVMEISSRSMISGVARLVYAISIALQLGFGMALGSELAWWASPLITTTCEPINRLWHILTFFGVAISFNILLNANVRQWPGMTFASAIGLLISEVRVSVGGCGCGCG